MSSFQIQDADFERRVRENFSGQHVMSLIGASLRRVEPGAVDIALPYRRDLTQQDGFIHAGILTTIADSACGYAAYTLMPAGSEVLSVEFKVNFLRPAAGEVLSRRHSPKAGKTLGDEGRCPRPVGRRDETGRDDAGDDDSPVTRL